MARRLASPAQLATCLGEYPSCMYPYECPWAAADGRILISRGAFPQRLTTNVGHTSLTWYRRYGNSSSPMFSCTANAATSIAVIGA